MKAIYNSFFVALAIFAGVFVVSAQQQEDITLKSAKNIAAATSIQPKVTQSLNGEDVTIKATVIPSNTTTTTNAKVLSVGEIDPTNGEKITATVSPASSNLHVMAKNKGNVVVNPSGKEAERYKTVVHARHTGPTSVVHPSGKEAERYKTVVRAKHTGPTPVVRPSGKEGELKAARK